MQPNNEQYSNPKKSVEVKFIKSKVVKTEEEWKKTLSQEEYHILRQKGTEQAFTGKYLKNKKKGIYLCAACENELFSSDTKFDSGTGWPSFWAPVNENNVDSKNSDGHLIFLRESIISELKKSVKEKLKEIQDENP